MLPPLIKAPLGGLDRKQLVARLSAEGPALAAADLERDLRALGPRSLELGDDSCVLVLGGSNGFGRALVLQLLFGERQNVFVVHNDSERLQIGPHHVRAMRDAAEKAGLESGFMNDDATNPKVVNDVITALRARYATVHLFNSIAAGAPKRYAEHGTCEVPDIDVEMDPLRQVADFSRPENARAVGLVKVEVATPADIERTDRLMGTSTELWANALAEAKLLTKRSVVAFADYDFEPDNPVYGMGPLAGAKRLQRESMKRLRATYGVRGVRVCYPAMNTTALSIIPGGLLMYAATAHLLGQGRASLPALAAATMPIFAADGPQDELRLDGDYQAIVPRAKAAVRDIDSDNWRALIAGAFR